MTRIALILVLLAFGALTAKALMDFGYIGIFTTHFTSSAGMQVLIDLVIVCTLAIFWIVGDARRNGRNPWPYVVLTVTAGSFGPLLYLLLAPDSKAA